LSEELEQLLVYYKRRGIWVPAYAGTAQGNVSPSTDERLHEVMITDEY
jgi:hypothetical protein